MVDAGPDGGPAGEALIVGIPIAMCRVKVISERSYPQLFFNECRQPEDVGARAREFDAPRFETTRTPSGELKPSDKLLILSAG